MSTTPQGGTHPAPSSRLAWIDMARGFCVVAVVLLHVGLFHVFPLAPDSHGRPLARAWVLFNTAVLADLRMPLLLLLSGYLARTKIREGLSYARTRIAIATNLHLYLVWTLVFFALGVLFYPSVDPPPYEGRSPVGLVVSLLHPQTGPLWFVYVLFVSLAVLAATRRLPVPLVLAGFLAVGWIVVALTHDTAGLPRAIFYATGALLGERLIALTDSHLVTVLALLTYGGLMAGIENVDPARTYPVIVLAGLCAAVAFLAIAKILARVSFLRVPGAWIGRRTLGVYVLHWPFVAALTWLGMAHPDWFRPWLQSQAADVVYPVVATALVIVLCMATEKLLKAVGLGVLFDPPESVKRRLTRTARHTREDVASMATPRT